MQKNILSLAAFAFMAMLTLSNCASLTGFQDGRTVGRNNGEIMASLNLSQSPDFNQWEEEIDSVNVIPNLYVPSLEFGGRYGVGRKVDVSLRVNTNLNIGFGAKVQVIGDRKSPFALALGAEAGTFGLITGLWNLQVPVYCSIYPTEKIGVYFTPRFIYQFSSYTGASYGATYLGGNTGLLFGGRNKFGLDFGYYRLGAEGESIGLINFGIGGRFTIGRNDDDED